MPDKVMDDSGALQYPSSISAGDVGNFSNLVIDIWATCDIAGHINEHAYTSRNLVFGLKTGQKHRIQQ